MDPGELDAAALDPVVVERQAALRRERPERLVVRVDRTDPSKNILRGFRAFELLLERYPEHRGRVRMLALLDPSRQEIPEYATYSREIEQAAADVNERAGATVIDLRLGDDFPLSVAAYTEYDVLFVNPIFDGLNLVAKEGPLLNERNGVLVLSENAGAADELAPWALLVSPFDLGEQADACTGRSNCRRTSGRRVSGLREHIRAHDIGWWAEGSSPPSTPFPWRDAAKIGAMAPLRDRARSVNPATLDVVGGRRPSPAEEVARPSPPPTLRSGWRPAPSTSAAVASTPCWSCCSTMLTRSPPPSPPRRESRSPSRTRPSCSWPPRAPAGSLATPSGCSAASACERRG